MCKYNRNEPSCSQPAQKRKGQSFRELKFIQTKRKFRRWADPCRMSPGSWGLLRYPATLAKQVDRDGQTLSDSLRDRPNRTIRPLSSKIGDGGVAWQAPSSLHELKHPIQSQRVKMSGECSECSGGEAEHCTVNSQAERFERLQQVAAGYVINVHL
jgi:hypothetical protein